ncbi:MAG TPA: ATP-binding protein [Tepidisphaeraceae bacterium]|nr:ATP-binding protein [Tepidisphaeraceae bacterium]
MFRDRDVPILLIELRAGVPVSVAEFLEREAPRWATILTTRGNFIEALEVLATHKFDAIIVAFPEEGALKAIGQVHSRSGGAPMIVLGDVDDPIFAAGVLAHGAEDYLAHGKFDGPLLVRAIEYGLRRIADRRQMEDALAEERNLLRSVIDAIPDHIYVKDVDHRFVLGNLATYRFFGMAGEEVIGRTDDDFFPATAAASFMREEERIMRSGQPCINRETHAVSADGRQQWTLTTKAPLRDKGATIVGIVGINRDITQRKLAIQQVEQTNDILARRELELLSALEDLKRSHEALQAAQMQLMQVEKMESVGRLAAGIAHEVKNPLAIIATGIDFLKLTAPVADESVTRVLGSMGRAVKRADSVIRGLLDFSRPAALRSEPSDLNTIIRHALLLVDHELMRCKIVLHTDFSDPLPAVSVDSNKIEQVFLNLFINAIHAMPDGGSLTLRTRSEQLAALGHNIGDDRNERFRAGDAVVIAEVDDTGHGIPDDKLAKVFDPFFTTKPTGKGTGLGLSVAKTIVDLHGGLLQLANRAQGGVCASLVLKATGDSPHDHHTDGIDAPDAAEDSGFDRGRRGGLHAYDGDGIKPDRVL